MTLSLLVYSIAQRKLRQALQAQIKVIPNQINKPTQTPTLRWVFQLLEGIDIIRITIEGKVQKILVFFGSTVCPIYELSP